MNAPRWRGEPLAGKRLLVWREQGVGDEILFSSCLKELIGAGAETVVRCDRRLVSLFSRSFPSIRFIPDGQEITLRFDYHTPMGSLPGLTRRTLANFASVGTAAWLRPDETTAAAWRRRLAALPRGLMVGIAWKSGLVASEREATYTALVDWLPLFKMANINLINLQYGQCEEEIRQVEEQYGVSIWRWNDLDLKDDFEQTAALVSELDLIICPATAVGELAGALGGCVWRLGARDWTFLGAAVRPWFSSQRPILPKDGAPNAAIPFVIAKELDRLISHSPPTPSVQEERRFETAAHDDSRAPASHQHGADDPARL
ncbi:MAG TPA: hypothetical protein PKZ97_12015 [Azospirillaceae bacterium]|nr:hypothetical protein [Azospirillaceae bacterium]